MVPCVFASDWGYINEPLQLWGDVFQNNTFYAATNANITLYAPNLSVVLNNVPASAIKTGVFEYNYTPDSQGVYYAYVNFYSGSSFIGSASQSFAVVKRSLVNMEILTAFLLIIIGLVFVLIAKYTEQPNFIGLAVLWFLGLLSSQVVGVLKGISIFSTNGLMAFFYLMVALILIIHWLNETE